MNSPGDSKRPPKWQWQVLSVSSMVVCLGLGAMVAMGSLLYVSVVMNPTLLNHIVPETKLCQEMRDDFQDLTRRGNSVSKYQQEEHGYTNGILTRGAGPGRSEQLVLGQTGESEDKHEDLPPLPQPVRILIGIMTMAKKTERRHLLRMAYSAQSTENSHVEVKFVIGKINDEMDKSLVGLENLVYHDIMELDCEENMNHGKTFTFFSTLAQIVAEQRAKHVKDLPSYDYVMKTDDDSYVRIDNLAKHLSPLPRADLYYGYILPCQNQDPYKWYMAGMGYVISWDLVEWIKDSPIARNNSEGTEDQLVGKWFDEGGKAKNRVNDKPLFYDHPAFGGDCAHELIPETILVHQVKTLERWAGVISFFENDGLNKILS